MSNLGISDFFDMFDDREADINFSLYAVKAPFQEVTQAFFEFHNKMAWDKDVPKRLITEDDVEDLSYALVEILDSEWVIVLEAVFIPEGDIKETRMMSECLGTRTLGIWESDHGVRYELFENGRQIEYFEYGDEPHFNSQFRDMPPLNLRDTEDPYSIVHAFINEIFIQEEIYVPACYPQVNEDVYLSTHESAQQRIGRADIIHVGGSVTYANS